MATPAALLLSGQCAAVKQSAVDLMLDRLGLSHVADTLIGSPLRRGISGGQAKRVNIGIALITEPRVLFLDEVGAHVPGSRQLHHQRQLRRQLDDCLNPRSPRLAWTASRPTRSCRWCSAWHAAASPSARPSTAHPRSRSASSTSSW